MLHFHYLISHNFITLIIFGDIFIIKKLGIAASSQTKINRFTHTNYQCCGNSDTLHSLFPPFGEHFLPPLETKLNFDSFSSYDKNMTGK
jgi:hypothetical protein